MSLYNIKVKPMKKYDVKHNYLVWMHPHVQWNKSINNSHIIGIYIPSSLPRQSMFVPHSGPWKSVWSSSESQSCRCQDHLSPSVSASLHQQQWMCQFGPHQHCKEYISTNKKWIMYTHCWCIHIHIYVKVHSTIVSAHNHRTQLMQSYWDNMPTRSLMSMPI